MLDAKLESDPAQTYEQRRKLLKEQLNNLVLAAVGVYGEATDRGHYAGLIRGIINNACELGGQFERETRNPDSKDTTRPPQQEAPQPEPVKVTTKAKAQEAAAKL